MVEEKEHETEYVLALETTDNRDWNILVDTWGFKNYKVVGGNPLKLYVSKSEWEKKQPYMSNQFPKLLKKKGPDWLRQRQGEVMAKEKVRSHLRGARKAHFNGESQFEYWDARAHQADLVSHPFTDLNTKAELRKKRNGKYEVWFV
jgi:hypothetical protein